MRNVIKMAGSFNWTRSLIALGLGAMLFASKPNAKLADGPGLGGGYAIPVESLQLADGPGLGGGYAVA